MKTNSYFFLLPKVPMEYFILRFIKRLIANKCRSSLSVINKQQFIERLSHEWRTSLTGVLGYAEFLEVGSAEPMMNFTAKVIRESGLVLARVTTAYIDLHHLEQGQLTLNSLKLNLSNVVEQVVDKARSNACERDVSLVFHSAVEVRDVSIYSDLIRIVQVVDAIIFNLIQLVDKWSLVYVSMSSNGQGPVLYFEYSCPRAGGVDLYEQFWNRDDYFFQLQAGPGVELAFVKELIHFLGASLKYEVDAQRASRLSIDFSRLTEKST